MKSAVPPGIWEQIKSTTRRSWLFGSLFTLFMRKYSTDGLVFEVPGKLFPIPLRSAFFFGGYEQYERAQIEAWVTPEDAVVELGGAIGVLSCVTNRILADKERHVVVEPHPEAIPFLFRNRQHNKAGFLILNNVISPNKVEEFVLAEQLHNSRVGGGERAIRIPGTTLREINGRFGPFTVLVMDIEGAEKFVVESDLEEISGFRLVIMELHPHVIGEEACDKIRTQLACIGLRRLGDKSNVEAWMKQT